MSASPASPMTGIDRLIADTASIDSLRRKRVGLLSNRACLTHGGQTSARALADALGSGDRGLVRLFAPEHGFDAVAADGAGVADGLEPDLGLPVHSLYGTRRAPTPASLEELDAVIVDLQDIGVRCYTYVTTAALMLATLAGRDIEAILCDRPNPLGANSAGPGLDPELRSFVGYLDVPFQHGRTMAVMLGDFATRQLSGKVDLTILAADCDTLGPPAPWTPPSPSLADWHAVRLYPGLVFLEGTNVSEGRGTETPFRCIGAPGLDGDALAAFVNGLANSGVHAHSTEFVPNGGKLQGMTCRGVNIDVTAFDKLDGLALGVRVLCWLAQNFSVFAWTKSTLPVPDGLDPLKFVSRSGYFVDYLLGDKSLRISIDDGEKAETILARWRA